MQEIFRTKHSKTFDTGQRVEVDGQEKPVYQTVIQKGLHYHDGQQWQEFDGTWELDTGTDPQGDQLGWKMQKADHHLRLFTQNPNKKKIRVGFLPGVFVEYQLPNVGPANSGNVCTMAEAWPGVDLKLTAYPEGMKNDLVLKAPGHPASFSFPIQTTGCTPQLEGNTLVYYHNSEPVGRIPASYMVDANGEVGPVALVYDGQNVILQPDLVWLAGAAYPVTVDPTTTIQPDPTSGIDAYYASSAPDANFNDVSIVVGKLSASNYRSNIKFTDLSSVPAGATINTANLSLYVSSVSNTNLQMCYAYNITAAWTETSVTWNGQPGHDAAAAGSVNMGAVGWYSIPMTALVAGWKSGSVANNGVKLIGNESTTPTRKIINSSDYIADTTLRPKLVVDYTEAGGGAKPTWYYDMLRRNAANNLRILGVG